MLKTIRNIALSIFILVAIFLASGVAYVLITGRSDNNAKNDQAVTPKVEDSSPIPKPKKPSPNANVSAAIESLTSPVNPGANSSITVRTLPGAACTISVTYNNVPSKDSGLAPRAADDYGNVTWSWTVDKSAPIGTWPVKVTCALNKKSGVVIGNLQVTK